MKAAVAFVLVMSSASLAAAQVPGYPNGCASCIVTGSIDLPTPTQVETITSGGMFGAAGWLFFGFDGQGVDRVEVAWFDNKGYAHYVDSQYVHYQTFARPDVNIAYAPYFPAIAGSQTSGWWIGVDHDGLPNGTHVIQLSLWHGVYPWWPNGFGPQITLMRTVVVQ